MISYDHIKDAVELCQRTGRARDHDSSIVILDERPDRPLAMLEDVRAMQDEIVQAFDPSATNPHQNNPQMEQARQLNREQTALRRILEKHPRCHQHSLKAIHEYTQKTRASLMDEYSMCGHGRFQCTLTYQSSLRNISVNGEHTSKKNAKQFCALALLATLEDALFQ